MNGDESTGRIICVPIQGSLGKKERIRGLSLSYRGEHTGRSYGARRTNTEIKQQIRGTA